MNTAKRERLEKVGFRVSTVADLLFPSSSALALPYKLP